MNQASDKQRTPYDLSGKLVFVTGSGTGIGQGIALELARQGADVVVHYSESAAGANETVAQIVAMGRRSTAIQGNLGEVNTCRRVVDQAVAFLGGLDALVNNSGVTVTLPFAEVTEELFDRIYNINIRGQFFCAQQALPYLLQRGAQLQARQPGVVWAGGSIINISSVHGFAGFSGHSVYAGTKGAIDAFSRELAVELCQSHIRVNVIAPGSVEVARYANLPNYTRERGNSFVPWGRVGIPADIGYAAAFLVSDASEFMTGHVMYIDGGLTAKMAIPQL